MYHILPKAKPNLNKEPPPPAPPPRNQRPYLESLIKDFEQNIKKKGVLLDFT